MNNSPTLRFFIFACFFLLFSEIQALHFQIYDHLDEKRIVENDVKNYLEELSSDEFTFDELWTRTDENAKYIRYTQSLNGTVVWNATITVKIEKEVVSTIIANWMPKSPQIDWSGSMDMISAIEYAKTYSGIQLFLWEDPLAEAALQLKTGDKDASHFPTPTLVLTESSTAFTGWTMAYVMDIRSQDLLQSKKIVLDSYSGELIGTESLVHQCTSPGTANTTANGNISFLTDDQGTDFRLHGCQHSSTLQSVNYVDDGDNNLFDNYEDFIDDDNVWSADDDFGMDAHFGLLTAQDYFANEGVNSFENETILSIVNVPMANAFFTNDPSVDIDFAFGNNPDTGTPFVCLDIAAHEYTHSITIFLSNLSYIDESGYINEMLSDIFGTVIESAYHGLNWDLGECLNDGDFQRSMSNPNSFMQPDTYGGQYWQNNSFPQLGSGVGNFWFYLLTEGGTGVNDLLDQFEVEAIGMDDAAAIVLHMMQNYLGAECTYAQLRELTLLAARDLFSACSAQYIACMNAWYAVGVGMEFDSGEAPVNLTSEVGSCLAILCWENTSAEQYILEFWPAGDPSNITTITEITSTEETICATVELDENTAYEWQVFAFCGDMAFFSEVHQFETLKECLAVENLIIDVNAGCAPLASWDHALADYYLVEAAEWPSTNYNFIPDFTTTETSANFPHLVIGNTYTIKVTPFCCDGISGPATVSDTFTVVGTCEIPTYTVSASACQIIIDIDPIPGQSYGVQRPNGSTTFNNSNRKFFSAEPNTLYEFRLQVRCGPEDCYVIQYSDWFQITTPPLGDCLPPNNVQVELTDVAGFAGFLTTWDPSSSETSYVLSYRCDPTEDFIPIPASIYSPQYFIGRTCDYFEVCVASVCDCDDTIPIDTSDFTCFIFEVLGCEAPSNIVETVICPDEVALSWPNIINRDEYFIRYTDDGGTTWNSVDPIPWRGANFTLLTGLEPDTEYCYQISTECYSGEVSDWSPLQCFTTPPKCVDVSGTSATVSGDTVTFDWIRSPLNGYSGNYDELRFKLIWETEWNELPIIVEDHPFSMVLPCGEYEYQVRSLCGECGISEWSPSDTFEIICDCGFELQVRADTTLVPCEGGCVTLMAGDAANYSWEPAGLVDDPNSAVTQACITETTTFIVSAWNAADCVLTMPITITVDTVDCPNDCGVDLVEDCPSDDFVTLTVYQDGLQIPMFGADCCISWTGIPGIPTFQCPPLPGTPGQNFNNIVVPIGTAYSVEVVCDTCTYQYSGLAGELCGGNRRGEIASFNDESSSNEIKIIPNPAHQQIELMYENRQPGDRYHIVNTLGQSFFNDELESTRIFIPLTKMEAGVYSLFIFDKTGQVQAQELFVKL